MVKEDKGAQGEQEVEERRNLLLPDIERWPSDPDKPIIELQRVWKSYGGKDILKGVDLRVVAGETVVIMGESGSGKSILLRMMTGLETPDHGEVFIFGRNVRDMSTRELLAVRKRFGMLFQNYALMDSFTVRDNIAFPVQENTRVASEEIDRRVRDLLEMLDLPHAYNKFPNELSGGMKKRVGLARALITNPELVFFDEPTTGLDPVMIEFVDQLIIRAQRSYNITSVIISHDVGSVSRLATRVAMLHEGQIVQRGTFDEIRRSTHPWVHGFVNVGGSGRMSDENDDGAPAGAQDATRRVTAMVSCDDVLARLAVEPDEPVVEVKDLVKSFGEHTVLKGVNIKVPPKKITVLIGGSGSGKSVIIKHIIGLFRPDSGQVNVFGQDIAQADVKTIKKLRERFGMLFQHAALFDSMSIYENVAFPLVERRLVRNKAEVKDKVFDVLERLNIPDLAWRNPSEISNGQQKRVALARAIITQPEIMIYDEPTTGQDPVMIQRVDDMIEEAQEAFDITSIVISHDMVSTFRIADRVAMLYFGEILAYGAPAELRKSNHEKVREFIYAGSM